jgi:hypothetical protein
MDFVRRRGSHTVQTIVSQMALRLSALLAGGRPLLPRDCWYLFLLLDTSTPGSVITVNIIIITIITNHYYH